MAGRTAVLAIRMIADNRDAIKGMDETGKAAEKSGARLSKLKAPAAVAVGAIAALGKSGLDAASELQQSTGAVQSVYGKYAQSIIRNAKQAATAVGLSQSAYQNQAVLLGSQLKNLGTPIDQVAGKTTGLIKKASDLAATFGGSTADAVEAIGSLMRGESDPIERYGVSINQAAIQAYIAAHKLPALTQAQQKQAKTTAILALLNQQTAAATGQFAREQTSAAGAAEIAKAKFENARAALGQRLLPVYAKAQTLIAGVTGWVAKNSGVVFTLVSAIGALATVILIANGALKVYRAYQAVAAVLAGEQAAATGLQTAALAAQKVALAASAAAQWALNAAMSANPIMLVVIGLAALVAAFVVAYKRSETFRAIVSAAFGAVRAAAASVLAFFRRWGVVILAVFAPFIALPILIVRKWGVIRGFFASMLGYVSDRVRSFGSGVVSVFTGLPGRIAATAGRLLTAGKNIMGALFRGIGQELQGVGSFATDVARTVVNGIIRALNAALGLPWTVRIHIPIKFAPDINIGPYTIMPSIPLWGADAADLAQRLYVPARAAAPAINDLQPGFPLWAAGADADTWPAQLAPTITGRLGTTYIDRRRVSVTFPGLVTDPERVARRVRDVLQASDDRNGVNRAGANR